MIAIVDYRAGNLTSVRLGFAALDVAAEITSDPAVIARADRVVFPGVGAAGDALEHLRELALGDVLREVVAAGTPFLGICLGTQIILEHSAEDGGTETLGLLPGKVVRFQPDDRYTKIPQIGWNAVDIAQPHPLFAGIEDHSEFYFVHSYYPAPATPALTFGTTDYAGCAFASALGRENLFATQFHPERSGRIGLRMLANFVAWDGKVST